MKKTIANRMQTPDGTILWSRFTHDYVEYQDKNGDIYMIDGGNEYGRYSINDVPGKLLPVYDTEPWEVQREYRLWGTNGMWIPVAKLANEHLDNIINDGYRNEGILTESKYRAAHGIFIPEHDYSEEQIFNIQKHETLPSQ